MGWKRRRENSCDMSWQVGAKLKNVVALTPISNLAHADGDCCSMFIGEACHRVSQIIRVREKTRREQRTETAAFHVSKLFPSHLLGLYTGCWIFHRRAFSFLRFRAKARYSSWLTPSSHPPSTGAALKY